MGKYFKVIMIGFAMATSLVACTSNDDRTLSEKAGEKIGKTVTGIGKGIGEGIDQQLEVEVEMSEAMSALGMEKTVAKRFGVAALKKGYTVYMIANKPTTAKVISKALNDRGMEIGRSVQEISFEADEAKYIDFKFEKQLDMPSVAKFTLDVKAE